MYNFLRGTGVALVTPFNEDSTIDYDGLTRLIEYCIAGGVEYLVVLGTTGESVTLSSTEKKQIITFVAKVTNKRAPLVLGIGGNNTKAVINDINENDLTGYHAILSVVPMYNKPSQEGIYQHYKSIAEASPLPILLYNVPSRTGTNMEAKTTLRLASLDNIIGIKEAVNDLSQAFRIIKERPKGFLVISGDDTLALPMTLAGGDGVISVVGQGVPEAFSTMIRLALEGDNVKAFQYLYKIFPVIDLAFEEGNPVGIKSILKAKEICKDYVRLPLISASKTLTLKINELINNVLVQP